MLSIFLSALRPHSSIRPSDHPCFRSFFPFIYLSAKHISIPAGRVLYKICRKKSWLIWTDVTAPYMMTCASCILLDPFLLRLREVQDEDCRENSEHKTPVIYNLFQKIVPIIIIIIILFIIIYM
jgi:hypothetical protein